MRRKLKPEAGQEAWDPVLYCVLCLGSTNNGNGNGMASSHSYDSLFLDSVSEYDLPTTSSSQVGISS